MSPSRFDNDFWPLWPVVDALELFYIDHVLVGASLVQLRNLPS